MTQPAKICPQCGQTTALDAPFCLRCGHAYRTQFVFPQAPPLPTQPYSPPPKRRPWIWGTPLIALLFLGLWFYLLRPLPVLSVREVMRHSTRWNGKQMVVRAYVVDIGMVTTGMPTALLPSNNPSTDDFMHTLVLSDTQEGFDSYSWMRFEPKEFSVYPGKLMEVVGTYEAEGNILHVNRFQPVKP